MPSSIFLGAFASHPEILGGEAVIWESGDWFDPQSDSGLGGLGDCPPGFGVDPSDSSRCLAPDFGPSFTNCPSPGVMRYDLNPPRCVAPMISGGATPPNIPNIPVVFGAPPPAGQIGAGDSGALQCGPNEVSVTSSDWAGPVCMTPEMAMAYGAGLQQQKSQSASSLLSGITGTTAEWIGLGLAALILLSQFMGRRR